MQLVTDRVNMIDTMKDRKIGPAEVLEKFEVGPERVIDVQSLAGDSVDNVPGVPGIGIKTAALLINEYGDLETLLERAGEIKQNKRRENLIEFAEQARISRELVTLRTDTPLPVDMSEMGLTPPEAGMLMGFLKAMEFNTLTRRVSKRYDINADDYEASSDLAAKPIAISSSAATEKATSDLPPAMADMPPIDSSAYECVTDMAVLDNWIEDIIATGYVAIDTETDGLDAVSCRLVGISLATRPGHACYIPLAHGIGEGLALADDVPSQLAEADVLARLKPLLQDASIMKILQNAKFDLQVLGQRKIEVHPVEDTMLMSYALAAGQRGHGMDELSELYLGHKPISIKELLGTGKSQITFDQVPLEKATPYAAEDADITFRLWQMMRPKLVKDRVVSVYQTTEKPLVPVIVDMEKNGICVDRNVLSRLSGEFAQKMATMEEDIYK
jgi:DNA polymerase-1